MAFLAGAAIGAGMGILYAPESGERTRKKIKKSAKKAKEDLGERYEQLLQDVKEKAGNAKLGLSDRLERESAHDPTRSPRPPISGRNSLL